MDINVAYAQLSTAMNAIRSAVDSGSPEALLDTQHDLEDAINAWEGVDQWMRKSGFPPVAWMSRAGIQEEPDAPPTLVLPVTDDRDSRAFFGIRPAAEPVPDHMRPIFGHSKICSLLTSSGRVGCDCQASASGL